MYVVPLVLLQKRGSLRTFVSYCYLPYLGSLYLVWVLPFLVTIIILMSFFPL